MALRYLVVITCLALMAGGTYLVLDAIDDHVIPWTLPAGILIAIVIVTGYVLLRRRNQAKAAADRAREG